MAAGMARRVAASGDTSGAAGADTGEPHLMQKRPFTSAPHFVQNGMRILQEKKASATISGKIFYRRRVQFCRIS
jgi:hypothetical protein